MCTRLNLPAQLKEELLSYLSPENGIGEADKLAKEKMAEMSTKFLMYKEMARGIYIPG